MSGVSVFLISFVAASICYIMFYLGRIYECVVAIRELDDKLDQELFEREMMKKQVARLEKASRGEGAK